MENRSINLDLESGTSYQLSGNGSFITNSDNRHLLLLPNEIWFEETRANQIRQNARQCLMYRNGYSKALLTGLKPFGESLWYKGNILRFADGKTVKIQLLIFISQDKRTIEIYKPLGRAKKTTDKEKSLPEAFKCSQMMFHADTSQR
jgi:hypothetical protein